MNRFRPKIDNVIGAFSEDHVTRLTGLSKWQLRYWDRTDFFSPDYAYEDRRSAYSRVYSFRDVVALRTIAVLRNEFGVSIQELRKVAAQLNNLGFEHWSDVNLYVVNDQVHFRKPEADQIEGVWDGQYAMLAVVDVISDVSQKVEALANRKDDQFGNVERHRHVARNAWVIAGTRIPTAAIRRYKDAGYTVDQILEEYPSLIRKDIEAALSHEQRVAKSA